MFPSIGTYVAMLFSCSQLAEHLFPCYSAVFKHRNICCHVIQLFPSSGKLFSVLFSCFQASEHMLPCYSAVLIIASRIYMSCSSFEEHPQTLLVNNKQVSRKNLFPSLIQLFHSWSSVNFLTRLFLRLSCSTPTSKLSLVEHLVF
jgi:hypothetical protein